MLGPDHCVTEIRAPLIERGFEHLTARVVRDGLARIPDWDWIHWSGVSDEFAEALKAGGTQRWEPPLSYFVLDLPPSWEELRSRLKRNIRESLRHCYNSLKRDGHRFEFQVIEDPAGVRQGLDRISGVARDASERHAYGGSSKPLRKSNFPGVSLRSL